MCGIAGLWSLKNKAIRDAEFDKFIDSVAHRGPDGRGVWKDSKENLRFGHRRLAILDLSEDGKQPMSYANERFWITFNGEIYNFLELRTELEGLGYSFKSKSDTEVILASYLCFGEDCQLKFNGMWAFALYDRQQEKLFLSRDRFGVKPLFYYVDDSYLAFASELKAFLVLDGIDSSFDTDMVSHLLRDGTAVETTSRTILKGVSNLLPGFCATFSKSQGFKERRWWNTLDHLMEVPKTYEEQVEKFRSLFIDACRIRLRSDVPVGSALSGGLDSSSVLSTLALIGREQNTGKDRLASDWQKVFVASFPGTSQDESRFAQEVIKHTGTRSFLCSVDVDALIKNLDEALFQFEGIFDLPIGPWLLYREFRKNGVVISLDGHGADEYLGGYHHHVEAAMAEAFFPKTNPRRFLEIGGMWKGLYPEGSPMHVPTHLNMIKKSFGDTLKAFPRCRKLVSTLYNNVSGKKSYHWLKKHEEPWNFTQGFSDDPAFQKMDRLNQLLYVDFHSRTLPTILRNFDRCSMAHGVEIRAPFMDYRLVTYGFSLPQKAKIGNGYTKRILRDAMKGILPEFTRTRTAKVGFANPVVEWFSGALKPFILDSINSQSFLDSDIWDGNAIRNDVERCYKENDFLNARKCWEYVQADRLMKLFKLTGES